MPPSLTSLATSRVVGVWPRSNSSWCVAICARRSLFSLFIRQSSGDLFAPVTEQVVDCFLQGYLGRPAGVVVNTGVIAEHDWRVVGAEARRILRHRDLHAGLGDEQIDERSNRGRHTR